MAQNPLLATTSNYETRPQPDDGLAVFLAKGGPVESGLGQLLERILLTTAQLLGCRMGSICTIDESAQVDRKEVDLGAACHVGQVFSLDEGVTGVVVRAGGGRAPPARCRRHRHRPSGSGRR